MRGLFGVTAVSVALLIAGCSSTLDEYHCQSHEQCTGSQGQGLCHESGYCTYVDVECQGYRFGKHSGVQSEECVPQENVPDGGVPDAFFPAPEANIVEATLGCEETTLAADSSASKAFAGAELTFYAWTLYGPTGQVLRRLQGPPGLTFPGGSHFVSGKVESPLVNLPAYMDNHALRSRSFTGPNTISQDRLSLSPGDYALFFSIGDDNTIDGEFLDITVQDNNSPEIYVTTQRMVKDGLIGHRVPFSVLTDTNNAEIIFQHQRNEVWLDNIGIVPIPADDTTSSIVDNRSFELSVYPWEGSASGGGTVSRRQLEEDMVSYGAYRLELVVTDSRGQQSLPFAIELDHQACAN